MCPFRCTQITGFHWIVILELGVLVTTMSVGGPDGAVENENDCPNTQIYHSLDIYFLPVSLVNPVKGSLDTLPAAFPALTMMI